MGAKPLLQDNRIIYKEDLVYLRLEIAYWKIWLKMSHAVSLSHQPPTIQNGIIIGLKHNKNKSKSFTLLKGLELD